MKVPRLQGGRVGELQARRVQGWEDFQRSGVPGLELAFQGWNINMTNMLECYKAERFPAWRFPERQAWSVGFGNVWVVSTIGVAKRAVQDMDWCCRRTGHGGQGRLGGSRVRVGYFRSAADCCISLLHSNLCLFPNVQIDRN